MPDFFALGLHLKTTAKQLKLEIIDEALRDLQKKKKKKG